jgi:hypothetical protein
MPVQKSKTYIHEQFPKTAENPFPLLGVEFKARRVAHNGLNQTLDIVNRKDGAQVEQIAGFYTYEKVDTSRFIKLFANGVGAIKDLPHAGTRVFFKIAEEMLEKKGIDQLTLSYQKYANDIDSMSEATYNRGLKSLISAGIIRGVLNNPSRFWVNPNYIFNGRRQEVTHCYERSDAANEPVAEKAEELYETV